MEENKISLQALITGLMLQSSNLPSVIEYKGVTYKRFYGKITYEDENGETLKVDTLNISVNDYVTIIQDKIDNSHLIDTMSDKIDDLKDELCNVRNAIDDIDIRYQIDEANERTDNLEYAIDELENLVNELRGE